MNRHTHTRIYILFSLYDMEHPEKCSGLHICVIMWTFARRKTRVMTSRNSHAQIKLRTCTMRMKGIFTLILSLSVGSFFMHTQNITKIQYKALKIQIIYPDVACEPRVDISFKLFKHNIQHTLIYVNISIVSYIYWALFHLNLIFFVAFAPLHTREHSGCDDKTHAKQSAS